MLDRETKEEIIRAAYLALLADDRIAGEERKKLKDIATALAMPEIHFGAILEDLAPSGSRSRRRSDEASRLAESESMIVSHEHKFIFLKTKKTAGTSIELALERRFAAPDDVITPLTKIDEARRIGARGAQNWRLHGWWGSPRPLLQAPLVQIQRRGLRLLQSHAGERRPALLVDDKVWRSYFKFAFDRNPWDRQVSFYHHRYRRETVPPLLRRASCKDDARARINNYEIYSIDGDVAVDFVGRYESLEEDLKHALDQVWTLPQTDAAARQDHVPANQPSPIAIIMTTTRRAIVGDWYAREIELLDYEF